MAGKVENASSCLQWGNGRTPCLVCAGAGCGGRILEFIKRCAEPTSLGGLKMVATVLAGCLLLVGGGKSSMSFCLLPPQSECPTPRAPAPSKPLGCTTSYIKQWILWLDSHMGFFNLLVYFGGTPEHFVEGLESLQMFTKNCICSVGKCLLLLRPYLCLSEVLAWMMWLRAQRSAQTWLVNRKGLPHRLKIGKFNNLVTRPWIQFCQIV